MESYVKLLKQIKYSHTLKLKKCILGHILKKLSRGTIHGTGRDVYLIIVVGIQSINAAISGKDVRDGEILS